MVVDIQREYRFYTEKKKNAFKKHGHTPEIRRNRLQGTLNAKSPGDGIGLVWMTSGFGAGTPLSWASLGSALAPL